MTNQTTRRTVLAGAVALAVPATLPTFATPADPAVEAYRVWRAANEADLAYIRSSNDWETPEGQALYDQQWNARIALADAIATTPAGLAGQVRVAFAVFGELENETYGESPDDYTFGRVADDLEGRLLRSMLSGAENMAGVAS